MKRVNNYIRSLYCFFQLFGLHIKKSNGELKSKLLNGEKLNVYNEDDSLVGYVDYNGNDLKINIALMESVITADISCSSKSFIRYNVKTLDNKKLDGFLLISYDVFDELSIFSNVLIYDGDTFVGKCIFSSANNKLYIYDVSTNGKISYKNGRFSYTIPDDKYASASYEGGLVIYVMNNLKKLSNNIDGAYYSNDVKTDNLSSEEFISIINTIASEYKDSLDNIRGYINDINPEFFSSVAALSLNDKEDNCIKSILDMHDDKKFNNGRVLRKKN